MSEWPPITVTQIPDPSGTDPLGSYPLLDPIIPTELVVADDAETSPENRVAEYIDSRTETLRALANQIITNINAIQAHFLDRDGESNIRVDELTAATGRIILSGLPNDTDSITLNDGQGVTTVFEFDNNGSVTSPNVAVVLGSDAQTTAATLIQAINAAAIEISAVTGLNGIVRLTNDVPGSLGNQTITGVDAAGVQTLEGMSGGLDADEAYSDPSYMRGNFDMGGFKITDLADAVNPGDLVTKDQWNDVYFSAQDDVEQVLTSSILRRDGTVQMGADLNLAQFRITGLGASTLSDQLIRRDEFDTRRASFATDYVNIMGTNPMTGDLDMQDTPMSVAYEVYNLGYPTSDDELATKGYLDNQLGVVGAQDVPVGAILPFAGPYAEISGRFLLCVGQEVSRTVYQALFLVVGTNYGTPSSVNVFKLPDLRGRAIVGLDNMGTARGPANRITVEPADTLGGNLGTETVTLAGTHIPSHDHTYADVYGTSGSGGGETGGTAQDSDNVVTALSGVTALEGVGGAHPNMAPSMALNWVIRY